MKPPFGPPELYGKFPHERIKAGKLFIFSSISFLVSYFLISKGYDTALNNQVGAILYTIISISGICAPVSLFIILWRFIKNMLSKLNTKSKRTGIVVCVISIMTGSISAFICKDYRWNCWYKPDTMYEIVFFVSVLAFFCGFLFVVGIPQKIVKWINSVK